MANIPYTTVMTILKKGVTTGSFINVKKICEALDMTVDELENKLKNTFDNNDNNNNQALNLTSEQILLIEQFSKLNTQGKNEAIKRVEELSYIEKYKNTVLNQSEISATKEIDNKKVDISILPKKNQQQIMAIIDRLEYVKSKEEEDNTEQKTA